MSALGLLPDIAAVRRDCGLIYAEGMCGRIIQSSSPLHLAIVDGLNVSGSRMDNVPPRYNAAPSQELLVIRDNHETGERSIDLIKWGLIPYGCKDPKGGACPFGGGVKRPAYRSLR